MFVVLEGIDGSGKTTVCSALSEKLSERGYRVAVTEEPTELIRPLLSGGMEIKDPAALFLLFTADRMEHQERIKKLLSSNDIVLCDRYLLSSFAYQGVLISQKYGGWDRAMRWMESVSEYIHMKPDLTILLDSDPEVSLKRIREKRGALHPYFENENYLTEVRNAYRKLVGADTEVIDSTGDISRVVETALRSVTRRL